MLALVGLFGLTACDVLGPTTSLPPQARPAGLSIIPATPAAPSARSADLARYYHAVQSDLLTQGLLRIDGGGPDTPFGADELTRNFEEIAFFDEYNRSGGVNLRSQGKAGRLSRWQSPVRIGIEFGTSVDARKRQLDQGRITRYGARLARITRHPITTVSTDANFHVFVAGEDDRAFVQRRLKELIPSISDSELGLFANLPRSFYCLVVAVAGTRNPHSYTRAVALIRAEHPDLVRHSCIHEEIAQGLGLSNDSPAARPSIFNDDDEFALLTTHDEFLLKMLYDPRLKPGMTADEARPLALKIAQGLTGKPL